MARSPVPGVVLVLALLPLPARPAPGLAAEPVRPKPEPAKPKPEMARPRAEMPRPRPMQKANLERMFKRLDADKDGRISQAEFRKLAELGQGRLKDKTRFLDRLFEKLDADKDGFLTLDEFSGLRDLERTNPPKPKKEPAEPPGPDDLPPAAPK